MVVSRSAFAPGRVNLMGDHTDYTGGYAMPMAIQLGTTVSMALGGKRIRLRSEADPEPADFPLDVRDPSAVRPSWARYVAGVVAEIRPAVGGTGTVATTLPLGAGLASSAALEVASALALGHQASTAELARACQRAEQRAVGVPCGVMDQLACAAGVEGHALLIDCATSKTEAVPLPPDCEVVAVPSGSCRSLARSRYAERRAECEKAAALLGSLRSASLSEVDAIPDAVLRHRARHVVTENQRVLDFAECVRQGRLAEAGALMLESHLSLRGDFEVSTTLLDDLVGRLMQTPGVYGARLTGAGFGGCVVALTRPGVLTEGWVLQPSAGARLL